MYMAGALECARPFYYGQSRPLGICWSKAYLGKPCIDADETCMLCAGHHHHHWRRRLSCGCGEGRPGRQDEPHLHRRRRIPGAPRGQGVPSYAHNKFGAAPNSCNSTSYGQLPVTVGPPPVTTCTCLSPMQEASVWLPRNCGTKAMCC